MAEYIEREAVLDRSYNCMFETYWIGYQYNGHWGGEDANGTRARVITWMLMPKPPKEEESK